MRRVKCFILLLVLVIATIIPVNAARAAEIESNPSDIIAASVPKTTVVNPTKPDTTAPVFNSVSLSKTDVTTNKTVKEEMTLYIKLTEKESGLDYGAVVFQNTSGRTVTFSVNSKSVYDSSKKAYISTETFYDSQIGYYTFSKAYFHDKAGNYVEYDKNSTDCPSSAKKASFYVSHGTVKATAKLSSLTYSQSTLPFKASDSSQKKLSATVTVGFKTSGSKISDVGLSFTNGRNIINKGGLKPNSSGKISCNLAIKNDFELYGSWYLLGLVVNFENGDAVYLNTFNGGISSKYTDRKLKVTGAKDSAFPSVKTASFKSKKVSLKESKDGTVNLLLKISDKDTGVKRVTVGFINRNTNKYISSCLYLDKTKTSGEITLPIKISRFLPAGKYELAHISVTDAGANETVYVVDKKCYKDSATRVYRNFTSDMKGMTIVVKNTYK